MRAEDDDDDLHAPCRRAAGGAGAGGRTRAAQNREHQQQAAELRILQEQQQQLSLAIAQLAEAIKALQRPARRAARPRARASPTRSCSIRELSGDLGAIRERTQETDTRMRTLRDEIDALRTTLISRCRRCITPGRARRPPTASDPALAPPGAPAPVSAAPPAATGPAPSTAGLSPVRMLDSAKSDYFAGQWSLALSGFDALLRTFPRSESAGEAQFYIGETYYAQNKWREAIDAYGAGAAELPQLEHRARRVLQARARLRADRARSTRRAPSWEAVIKTYPDSDAARLAKQDLERINRTSPPAK